MPACHTAHKAADARRQLSCTPLQETLKEERGWALEGQVLNMTMDMVMEEVPTYTSIYPDLS